MRKPFDVNSLAGVYEGLVDTFLNRTKDNGPIPANLALVSNPVYRIAAPQPASHGVKTAYAEPHRPHSSF